MRGEDDDGGAEDHQGEVVACGEAKAIKKRTGNSNSTWPWRTLITRG
ncbi:MAG: hypothetical protein OJF51_003800 [Nitrospira sp.]|nr:MAG: hypothetical protein OJF51_003800 [Nitrospira sp.]